MAKTSAILEGLLGVLGNLAEGEAQKKLAPEILDGLKSMDEAERAEVIADLKAALVHLEAVNPESSNRQLGKASRRLAEAFVPVIIAGVS